MFSLKRHQNTVLPRGCDVGLNPKKQVTLPAFAPIFYSTSRPEYCCSNRALWKWSEPRAGASQGVKSTVTARILRFVIVPVTALQGVPISRGMKVWESSVLNAKSLFQAELHHPEGTLVLSCKPWQAPSAARALGPGFFLPPSPASAACSNGRSVMPGF